MARKKPPKYQRRSDSTCGFVWWQGKRVRIPGEFESDEGWANYHRWLAEVFFPETGSTPAHSSSPLVAELIITYPDNAYIFQREEGKRVAEIIRNQADVEVAV